MYKQVLSLSLALCAMGFSTNAEATRVVILLDSSGSMGGNRMNDAKRSLKQAVNTIPSGTEVGLLTFDGWAYNMSVIDHEALKRSIDQIRADGGTPLVSYMEIAARELSAGDQLILVTDGEDTKGRGGELPTVARSIRSKKTRLNVIGARLPSGHTLQNEAYVDSFVNASDQESLSLELRRVLAESFSDQAEEATLVAIVQSLPDQTVRTVLANASAVPDDELRARAVPASPRNTHTAQPSEKIGCGGCRTTDGGSGMMPFAFIAIMFILTLRRRCG